MTPAAPMTLGDVFDRWFKLIGASWLRNLILAAILLGPAALVFAVSLDLGFGQILIMDEYDPRNLATVWNFLGWISLGSVIFLIGTVAATVAITITGCAEMSGRPMAWQEALRTTFSLRLARVFGMYLLEFAGFGFLIGIPYALLIGGIAAESLPLGFAGGILIIVSIVAVIYLVINFAFTVPAIAWEQSAVIDGFKRSWTLVGGNWWRVFGILVLMSLVVSFAVSLVMTPLYIVVLWDFFQAYFELFSSLGGGEPDPQIARNMLSSFGFGFGLVNAIASIIQIIVTPLYTVVLYFDLRARRGEFNQSSPLPA